MEAMLKEFLWMSLEGSASIMSTAAFKASGMYIMSMKVPAAMGQTNSSPLTAA